MLREIQIGNFKCFGDTVTIPLRPITLIYGQNSSGKSSIIHSLVLLRHALETNELDVHRTDKCRDEVDLGGFKQYVHKSELKNLVNFSLSVFPKKEGDISYPITDYPLHEVVNVFNLDGILPDNLKFSISFGHIYHANDHIGINRFTISVGETQSDDYIDWLSRLNEAVTKAPDGFTLPDKLPSVRYLSDPDLTKPVFVFEYINGYLRIKEINRNHSFIKDFYDLGEVPDFYDDKIYHYMQSFCYFSSDNILPCSLIESGQCPDPDVQFHAFSSYLDGIYQHLRARVKNILYIGPYRVIPNLQLSGAEWLDKLDVSSINKINEWLSAKDRLHTRYEIITHWLIDPNKKETKETIWEYLETIRKAVTRKERKFPVDLLRESIYTEDEIKIIKEYFENEDEEGDKLVEMLTSRLSDEKRIGGKKKNVLIEDNTKTEVRLSDVGFGVSQLLPILVAAYNERGKTICIEQPEIHLHPALQADLGDLFIENALPFYPFICKEKNQFIIETHSENLLLRIMKRIRETTNGTLPEGFPPVKPSDVAVIFVERNKLREDSVVKVLELDEEGQLLDPWPGGFFEEGYKERFS